MDSSSLFSTMRWDHDAFVAGLISELAVIFMSLTAISVAAHWIIQRYWRASTAAIVATPLAVQLLVNAMEGASKLDWDPGFLLFVTVSTCWIPLLVGLPFKRRRQERAGPSSTGKP